MKKRFKIGKGKSQKMFTKNAVRVNRRNMPTGSVTMRGGTRL